MQEFVLTNLDDAGQLHEFLAHCDRLRAERVARGKCRCLKEASIRVSVMWGFMPSVRYWLWRLRREGIPNLTTVLSGSVGLPALMIWAAGKKRLITDDARLLAGGYTPGTAEYRDIASALSGLATTTEIDNLLSGTNIVHGPEHLRRVFGCQTPTPPEPKTHCC